MILNVFSVIIWKLLTIYFFNVLLLRLYGQLLLNALVPTISLRICNNVGGGVKFGCLLVRKFIPGGLGRSVGRFGNAGTKHVLRKKID